MQEEEQEAFVMSGRGGSSDRVGRGGRFNRSNQNNRSGRGNNTAGNIKKKKSIEDYYYYVGSSKQAADYNLTTEQIINHIKKEYDRGVDIAAITHYCVDGK